MLSRFSVALIALLPGMSLAAETPLAQKAPGVTYLGKMPWFDRGSRQGFGGFSGLEVSADGTSFRAITDNALTVTGRFVRDEGVITDLEVDPLEALLFADGSPIWANGDAKDAEGLAALPNGEFVVSFEGQHRLSMFGPDRRARDVPAAPEFASFGKNSGLEALAVDAQGALYALPERSGRLTHPFPVYRFQDGQWDVAFHIPRDEGFLPVGGDFGPDGLFYLLERAFPGYGFKSRVRRIAFDDTGITRDERLFTSITGAFDNLEGLSVWQDAEGHIRLTMLSDDNYKWFQQTQFVEFSLQETLAPNGRRP